METNMVGKPDFSGYWTTRGMSTCRVMETGPEAPAPWVATFPGGRQAYVNERGNSYANLAEDDLIRRLPESYGSATFAKEHAALMEAERITRKGGNVPAGQDDVNRLAREYVDERLKALPGKMDIPVFARPLVEKIMPALRDLLESTFRDGYVRGRAGARSGGAS